MTTWFAFVIERLLKPPEQSFFLLGPRGSGKSTWLKATFPDAHVIDLLSEATYQRLMASPGSFADELRAVAGEMGDRRRGAETSRPLERSAPLH
jgi:hypothetical protein